MRSGTHDSSTRALRALCCGTGLFLVAGAWSGVASAQEGEPAAEAAPAAKQAGEGAEQEPAGEGAEQEPAGAPKLEESVCARYAAALASGRAAGADPSLKFLAGQATDLVSCGAIKANSAAACDVLDDVAARRACRESVAIYSELRDNPRSRGFMINEVWMEQCRDFPPTAPYCDRLREAAVAGDPSACESFGELAAVCRALITLDASLCVAPKGEQFGASDANRDVTYGEDIARSCRQQIERGKQLAKGLEALADSGSPAQRAFAGAALGRADACAGLEKAAIGVCTEIPAPVDGGGEAAAAPAAGEGQEPAGGGAADD